MGRNKGTNKGTKPYSSDSPTRRSIRRVQLPARYENAASESTDDTVADTTPVIDNDQSSGLIQISHNSDSVPNRNVIVQDGQQPSTSCNETNTPTMEQFMLLQTSMNEMRNLMSDMRDSRKSPNNTHNVIPVSDNNTNLANTNLLNTDNLLQANNHVAQTTTNVNTSSGIDMSRIQNVMLPNTSNNTVGAMSNQVHNTMVLENITPIMSNRPIIQGVSDVNPSLVEQPQSVETSNVTTNNISQAVTQQVNSLLTQGENLYLPQSNFDEVSRVIDIKVSEKIKNQIWANQYVNLSVLLDPKADISDGYKLITGEGDQLCVTQNKVIKRLNGLSQWCDAFLIYMTVYSRKYPASVPSLTTYMHNIKMLHHKGGDFLYYDEEFRFMRQRNPNIGWYIDSNLWLECRDVRGSAGKQNNRRSGNNYSFRAQSTNNNKTTHPFGYCYKYHTQGRCANYAKCNYKHTCYTQNCNGKHPIFQCNKRNQNNNNSNISQTTATKPNNNAN